MIDKKHTRMWIYADDMKYAELWIPLSLVIPQKGQGLASLTPNPQPILYLHYKTIKSCSQTAEGPAL